MAFALHLVWFGDGRWAVDVGSPGPSNRPILIPSSAARMSARGEGFTPRDSFAAAVRVGVAGSTRVAATSSSTSADILLSIIGPQPLMVRAKVQGARARIAPRDGGG